MSRCVIYARYSSDMQRETSIEDQVRRCEEFASRNGWTVTAKYADRAISGAAISGREQLQALLRDSRCQPRTFDRLIVDDTSRLSRNLPEVLTIVEQLKFREIHVSAVTQGIDSAQDFSRQLFTLNGMIDEQYIVGLRDKVHRGQEGRALKGFNPGGKCYGYRNVPIENPSRVGKYGRPIVEGVRLEMIEHEAAIVRRIFELFSNGVSLGQIAKKLNAEGVQSPQPPRNRQIRAWCPSSIRSMLKNERYHGVFVWNRTQKQQNPETSRKTSRRRPANQWRRTEVPEWRIVSETLWKAVQARFSDLNRTGITRCGGFARSESSRKYVFSGLLRCGCCGSRMVIVSGQGRRGYSKYGCPSHWSRGVCQNRLTIRQDRLEAQLLGALQEQIWNSHVIAHALAAFEREVRTRLAQRRKETPDADLLRERHQLSQKAQHLAAAIADIGHSPTLLESLASIERRIAEIDAQLKRTKLAHAAAEPSSGALKKFMLDRIGNLGALVQSDPERAKAEMAKHLPAVVLTPARDETGPVFDVSGSWQLLSECDAMQVVARDGIEPPTPAFSELDLAGAISLELKRVSQLSTPE